MRRAQAYPAIGCKGQSVRSLTARDESDMACPGGEHSRRQNWAGSGQRANVPTRAVIHTQVFSAQPAIRGNCPKYSGSVVHPTCWLTRAERNGTTVRNATPGKSVIPPSVSTMAETCSAVVCPVGVVDLGHKGCGRFIRDQPAGTTATSQSMPSVQGAIKSASALIMLECQMSR